MLRKRHCRVVTCSNAQITGTAFAEMFAAPCESKSFQIADHMHKRQSVNYPENSFGSKLNSCHQALNRHLRLGFGFDHGPNLCWLKVWQMPHYGVTAWSIWRESGAQRPSFSSLMSDTVIVSFRKLKKLNIYTYTYIHLSWSELCIKIWFYMVSWIEALPWP